MALVSAVAVILAMALSVSSASAAQNHLFSSAFGGPGSGDGQLALGEHSSLAVNQTSGDVYVTDTGNGRVQEFSSTGVFIRAFGSIATPSFIAVDNSSGASQGDVYVVNSADNTILKFGATGVPQSAWGTNGVLSGGNVPFVELAGIAVDAAGNLNVIQNDEEPHRLLRFDQAGSLIETVEIPRGTSAGGLAIDTEGNFYKVDGSPEVTKFTPSGENLGEPDISNNAIAIDTDPTSGDLFVVHGSGFVTRYALNCGQACTPVESFGEEELSNPRGIAIGAGGRTYVADAASNEIAIFTTALVPDATTEAASEVKRQSATLRATVGADGGPPASCEFQYSTSSSFAGSTSVPCDPAGPFTGTTEQAVKAEIGGLSVKKLYFFRVLAKNSNGTNVGEKGSFQTRPPLSAETGEATNVSATGVTFNGLVNPEGIELEQCFFEYVTEAQFDASGFGSAQKAICAEAPAQIGEGETPIAVHVAVSGLTANTFYWFRVGAKNSTGTVTGEGAGRARTFGPPTIAYEAAAEVGLTTARIVGAINPDGIATSFQVQYVSSAQFDANGYAEATSLPVPPEEIGGGLQQVEVSQPLAGLSVATKYHYRLVATNSAGPSVFGADRSFNTLVAAAPGLPDGRAYELVSPTIKAGEVFVPSKIGHDSAEGCPEDCVPGVNQITRQPMQSSPDGESIVYEGQPFTGETASAPNQYLARRSPTGWSTVSRSSSLFATQGFNGYKAVSTDLSREVVYQVSPVLAPEAPTFEGKAYTNLYLRDGDGSLRPLITIKPPNRTPNDSSAAQFNALFAAANAGTAQVAAFSHLAFEANDSLTEAVSGIAPAAPEVPQSTEPGFQNDCDLDADCNLYMWIDGELSLVNVLPGNSTATLGVFGSGCHGCLNGHYHFGPNFDNAVSADGSHVFWSDAEGQVYVRINGTETKEVHDPGRYLYASESGAKVLLGNGCLYVLATEACEDLTEDGAGIHQGGFEGTLGTSADLSRVYYVDTAALTPAGEENENGEHAEAGKYNLYAWDAGSVSFIGILSERDNPEDGDYGTWVPYLGGRTAQVTPDGRFLAFMSVASLTGYENAGNSEVFEYDAAGGHLSCASCNPSGQAPVGSANLSLMKHGGFEPSRAPANLSSEGHGRLFFESQEALSSRDVNGTIQDVYEWEPDGIGSCTDPHGCISLLSDGSSPEPSFFLDSTPSGNDAFFVTRTKLLPSDTDDRLDLYDARVGGGIAEDNTPPCSGEACRGATTLPPAGLSPGSATFTGPGNARVKCAQGSTAKNGKCVRKKRHRKKHHRHGRTTKHTHGGNR